MKDEHTTPSLHLCAAHCSLAEPEQPCHILKLPTELRQEIFRYLMPESYIDSIVVHRAEVNERFVGAGTLRARVPVPLLNLLLGFNREIYEEIKDVFYSTATFKITITRSGVTLCGRYILPSSVRDRWTFDCYDHRVADQFIRYFPFSAVRNYAVNIVTGQEQCVQNLSLRGMTLHDDEVETYDLRDYVTIIVSGVLAKARRLQNLTVTIETKHQRIDPRETIDDARLLIAPFSRLRCVRKPRFGGVYHDHNLTPAHVHEHYGGFTNGPKCATASAEKPIPVLTPDMPYFQIFAGDWERALASDAPTNLLPKSPMINLFVEFKNLHNSIVDIAPDTARLGRRCFLHRARIAREQEDIVGFRAVQAELLACWRQHLESQARGKREVDKAMQRMLDADTYPNKGPQFGV